MSGIKMLSLDQKKILFFLRLGFGGLIALLVNSLAIRPIVYKIEKFKISESISGNRDLSNRRILSNVRNGTSQFPHGNLLVKKQSINFLNGSDFAQSAPGRTIKLLMSITKCRPKKNTFFNQNGKTFVWDSSFVRFSKNGLLNHRHSFLCT